MPSWGNLMKLFYVSNVKIYMIIKSSDNVIYKIHDKEIDAPRDLKPMQFIQFFRLKLLFICSTGVK